MTKFAATLRTLTFAFAVLIPGVASAQWGNPTSPSPGPSFVWAGQWVPCSHPLAVTAGLGCVETPPSSQVLTSATESEEPPAPPMQDEWAYTEAYSGVGTKVPVLVRTANPDRWFEKGARYIAPYADFRMTILERVKLPDGNWAWIGQITQSGGAPARGTVLSYPLYGDRNLWLTEEEFSAAVQANTNSGR